MPSQHREGVGDRVAPADLEVAEHHDEEHRGLAERPRQVHQELERRLVGPLQIVEHDHERPVAGRRGQVRARTASCSSNRRPGETSVLASADGRSSRSSPALAVAGSVPTTDSEDASHGHHDGAADPS